MSYGPGNCPMEITPPVSFFGKGLGSAIVLGIGIETRETWLTVVIRDARDLALGRGGRRYAAKSSAIIAATTPRCIFLFFIFGISKIRSELCVLRRIDVAPATICILKSYLSRRCCKGTKASPDVVRTPGRLDLHRSVPSALTPMTKTLARSAAAAMRSGSATSVEPATTATPARPAPAAASTVGGPITGRSMRWS